MNNLTIPVTKEPGQRSQRRSTYRECCGIYCIENTQDGKRYIGQSLGVLNRLRQHKYQLRRGTHFNPHLQRSFDKYGEECFSFYVLQRCEEADLDRLERECICQYQTTNKLFGYNSESGGNLNKHPTEEVRQKQSDSHKGKPNNQLGRTWTEKQRRICSVTRKGKHFQMSDEQKKMISEKHTGMSCPEDVKERLSNVYFGTKRGGSSKYIGVNFNEKRGKFLSVIKLRGVVYRLGAYENEIDAALAYDDWAFSCFGCDAKLNFKRSTT